MMNESRKKVAVITAEGINAEIVTAKYFVEEGIQVVITGNNRKKLTEIVAKVGNQAVGIYGNFANLNNLDFLLAEIHKKFGCVDVLFTGIGTIPFVPFIIQCK